MVDCNTRCSVRPLAEQPGSALNLRYILDWAWNKVVQTKEELDGICTFLFIFIFNQMLVVMTEILV